MFCVLGCRKATGTHKLKRVLIVKSMKPRCFKNVYMDALPVIYKSQRNAWINSEIFGEWFSLFLLFTLLSYFRLSRLFTRIPTSPDNRGSTVS